MPENRLQPAFQALQENAASEKAGNLVLGGLVVSFAGAGFSCSPLSSVWKGAPVPLPKHWKSVLSQALPLLSSGVGSEKSVCCYLPAALPSSLLKTRQTERFTLVPPVGVGFDPFHEVCSIEEEAWMMVIRGHMVVGEVSSCWILRSGGGGAAGHEWRNYSVWALIYTGGCFVVVVFFLRKLAPSFNFHSAGLTKLTAFHKCWWFK